MSNIETSPAELTCASGTSTLAVEVLGARDVPLGGVRAMTVRRTLPQRTRSLIGAWCFADHYGPDGVSAGGRSEERRAPRYPRGGGRRRVLPLLAVGRLCPRAGAQHHGRSVHRHDDLMA